MDYNEGVEPQRRGCADWENALEEEEVRVLCEKLGYGRVLQLTSLAWQKKGRGGNQSGIGMVIGPHVGTTTKCWHPGQDTHCDWCCGCGWVTEKVASVMPPKKKK